MGVEVKLDWFDDEVLGAIGDAVNQALIDCALDLKSDSQKQAPVDKGDLRGNCSIVDKDKVISPADKGTSLVPTGENHTIVVGYSLPYARRQHEELDYEHPKGGKSKYLEDPFNANVDKYKRNIANAVKEATR